jgi:hypothetical protein
MPTAQKTNELEEIRTPPLRDVLGGVRRTVVATPETERVRLPATSASGHPRADAERGRER